MSGMLFEGRYLWNDWTTFDEGLAFLVYVALKAINLDAYIVVRLLLFVIISCFSYGDIDFW